MSVNFLERAIDGYVHINEHYLLALSQHASAVGKPLDSFTVDDKCQAWLNHVLECTRAEKEQGE